MTLVLSISGPSQFLHIGNLWGMTSEDIDRAGVPDMPIGGSEEDTSLHDDGEFDHSSEWKQSQEGERLPVKLKGGWEEKQYVGAGRSSALGDCDAAVRERTRDRLRMSP